MSERARKELEKNADCVCYRCRWLVNDHARTSLNRRLEMGPEIRLSALRRKRIAVAVDATVDATANVAAYC